MAEKKRKTNEEILKTVEAHIAGDETDLIENDFGDDIAKYSVKELLELEQDVIKQIEAANTETKDAEIEIPAKCDYRGEKYLFAGPAALITNVMDRQKISWRFTESYKDIWEFWDSVKNATEPFKVKYAILDTTLRILGNEQYSGISEFRDVALLNEFLKTPSEAYRKLSQKFVIWSGLHDMIVRKLQQRDPTGAAQKKAATGDLKAVSDK